MMYPPAVLCSCCHHKSVDCLDIYPIRGQRVTLCLFCWRSHHDVRNEDGSIGLSAYCPHRLTVIKPDPDDALPG